MGRLGYLAGLLLWLVAAACDGDSDDDAQMCADFVVPERQDNALCGEVDVEKPTELVECLRGSGYAGKWSVDDDGLPAYNFQVDERCDPAGQSYSPRETPQRDPIHLIGNGRGLVAMAHASGGVEIYSQDRGHKWLNHIDTWRDPENKSFPPQLGGGFNYVVVGDDVLSTRFEDLPVGEATSIQSRRFGVGYVETVTNFEQVRIKRRVFAPDAEARALVAEVTLENPTDGNKRYGLVELWDIDIHQLPVEFVTSDLMNPSITETIDRRRRAIMDDFEHTARYTAADRVCVIETTAKQLPSGVTGRSDVSDIDYFPEPMFLAPIDLGDAPEAVWLKDSELWGDTTSRDPPSRAKDGDADDREISFGGEDQHGLLAVRVPVMVPAGGAVTRRFAFGYVPGGGTPDAAIDELRDRYGELRAETAASWRDRLVWAVFPGLAESGALQRELAWSSYNALAHATYDEYQGVRVLGQGGAYKYIHGLDGAIGDLALFAEAMLLVDPELARETLQYALATQHASSDATPWRFPYATTGVGDFSDVGMYDQRSDAYFLMPSIVAEYVAHTRDSAFLDTEVTYWPRSSGESGSVRDHLARSMDYATSTLGIGARGLIAMGTGDYADGVLAMTDEPTTPRGASSTYNAGFVLRGFDLAADVIEPSDAALAGDMRALYSSQAAAIEDQAWSGKWYYRGFVDSGNPLAPDVLFLEPQLFPILAGLTSADRRDDLLDLIQTRLETDIGAMSNVYVGEAGGGASIDEPQVGGIWPVANAWLTEAYARRDANEGWESLTRNTLAAHARAYPEIWYGIWTGPDSFNGPDEERPGEADVHAATALTDYPALNMHVHTALLRALRGVLGIRGTAAGLRIAPRVPSETYTVIWPRLTLRSRPTFIGGSVTASAGRSIVMQVLLPSGLRSGDIYVKVKGDTLADFSRTGDTVEFTLPGTANSPVAWEIGQGSGS